MKKKALLGILALLLAFTACGQKYDSESDFRIALVNDGKEVEVTSYLGGKQIVSIPPKINKLQVVSIGEEAFKEMDIICDRQDLI